MTKFYIKQYKNNFSGFTWTSLSDRMPRTASYLDYIKGAKGFDK